VILCQPGYSGYRGERQKIYLVHEYELSAVAGILAIIVRLERTQKIFSLEGGVDTCQGTCLFPSYYIYTLIGSNIVISLAPLSLLNWCLAMSG
jgi:hypothetical protein